MSQVRMTESSVVVVLMVTMGMASIVEQYVDKHVAKIWSVWHPIFASASLVMLVITVRQLYADLIAKTMENALSPMSVNVYQVTVAPLVKKHTVNHPVKMEARAWPEISVPAPMVL